MNSQNLIPNSERTTEELREMGRRGGIASGKSRRKKAELKKTKGENMQTSETEKTSAATMGDTRKINEDYNINNKDYAMNYLNSATQEDAKWILITPKNAQRMLDTMDLNRLVNQRRVDAYASDLKNGNWTNCYDPIAFNQDGHLINGQHRLLAIIKSNTPHMFIVITNVTNNTVFDKGLPRSSGDSLRCRGLISEAMARKNSVALANAIFKLKGKTPTLTTDSERAILLNKYEKEILLITSIMRAGGNSSSILRISGCGAAIFMALYSGEEVGKLYEFGECVNTGIISEEQSAAVKMRDVLKSNKKINTRDLSSITEQAIYDFVRKIKRTRAYKADKFPYSKNVTLEELLK